MQPDPRRSSFRTWPLALAAALIVCGLATPLAAATAQPAEPAPIPEQTESAADISGFLAQPAYAVTLTDRNAIGPETVGFQQTLRNGTLTVEIEWYENTALTDGVAVELYPEQWTDFRGAFGTDREASAVARGTVDDFLVDRWNRTLCGYRDMVGKGQVVFPDGDTALRTLGLTWQWSGEEMALADMAAAGNTSCPLNPYSNKCQSHASCVVTVNCGIISFDVDGRCMPQAPFYWPCVCDPLHDLWCDATHENEIEEH